MATPAEKALSSAQKWEECRGKFSLSERPTPRRNMVEGTLSHEPVLYDPKARINLQRTLVFPLRRAGNFNSTITNFKVTVVK